jgi:predicted dehydrogenase
MRIGLIGFGGMGRHHAQQTADNPGLELAAICDPSETARVEAAATYSIPVYATPEELLSSASIKGVLIAAPTGFHSRLIEMAAAAGKHVFCEKPLVLPSEDPEPVAAAIERAGITFGFGLVLRYMPPYVYAHRMILAGDLGRILIAHARYSTMAPATSYVFSPTLGGGLLNEHSIHMIDALEYLLGPVRSVSAELNRCEGRQTEDNASVLLRFDDGPGASLALSGTTRFPSTAEITGSSGEIAITGNTRLETVTATGRQKLDLPEALDPYYLEVEEWRQAIVEGRAPRTGIREALRITRILTAIRQAGANHQTVTVPAT